jgi:hypothetical protein
LRNLRSRDLIQINNTHKRWQSASRSLLFPFREVFAVVAAENACRNAAFAANNLRNRIQCRRRPGTNRLILDFYQVVRRQPPADCAHLLSRTRAHAIRFDL